jgi:phage terminase small subunit
VFVQEYVSDLIPNAAQAAIRAGYSAKCARQIGHVLLKQPGVKAAIEAAQKAQYKRIHMTKEAVLAGLAEIASVDVRDLFNEDGELLPLKEIPPGVRRAIAGIDVEELFEGRGESRKKVGRARKIKLWDKVRALEMLAKHHKLITEKVEHSGPDGGPIRHALSEMSEEALRAIAGRGRGGAGETPPG